MLIFIRELKRGKNFINSPSFALVNTTTNIVSAANSQLPEAVTQTNEKEEENFHEFYCVSCKVKRKKRADKNICVKEIEKKNGSKSYLMYSDCEKCTKKLVKFTNKETFENYKTSGKWQLSSVS